MRSEITHRCPWEIIVYKIFWYMHLFNYLFKTTSTITNVMKCNNATLQNHLLQHYYVSVFLGNFGSFISKFVVASRLGCYYCQNRADIYNTDNCLTRMTSKSKGLSSQALWNRKLTLIWIALWRICLSISSVKNSLTNVIKVSATILNLVGFSLFEWHNSDEPEK